MAKKLRYGGQWEVKLTRNAVPDRVLLEGDAWGEFLDEGLDELEDLADQHIARLIYDTPEGDYERTGLLAASGGSEVYKGKGIVYNEAPYAEYVHEGTRRMQARPWLEAALRDFHRRHVVRIAKRVAEGRRAY